MNTFDQHHGEIWDLAEKILTLEGNLRYCQDWDHEIVARLAQRIPAHSTTPLTFRRGADTFGLKKITVSGARTRRFDYARCEAAFPQIYRDHVTTTPPEYPTKLLFKISRGTGTSQTWNALRSTGWAAMHAIYSDKRIPPLHTGSAFHAAQLYEVRRLTPPLKAQRNAARAELAALLAPDPATGTRVVFGDGAIVPLANAPRRAVDLDMAEKHPILGQFVTSTARASYDRWVFLTERQMFGDDPEGDQWAE